ncbi:metalloregulator ArsR/SmtB family transcription factor [Actinoplanes sp. NPDC023801]|uniref:metalloregulator ArsR/SmtB family transcription factor n=1 Tax=Actinoplanes sp. NPDC023801 TaxID=3154595 RepID=UPI0033D5CE1A
MGTDAPPPFLTAAGHPIRWRLLSELARSDLAVHELTALLGQPQNLVSYHLGKLRKAGLVTARRSSADGRDTYYALHLDRCAAMIAGTGGALHPALRLRTPAPPPAARTRVLFLCTGNSARSQMAEAILRREAGEAAEVRSAGSNPKPVHPYAVAALASRGLDLSTAEPKHLDRFTGRRFDHVITLCDRVKEVCPEFGGNRRPLHWSIPDPSRDPAGQPAFERLADELTERIGFFLHTLTEEMS